MQGGFFLLPHLEYLDLSINAYDLHERREEASQMTVSRKRFAALAFPTRFFGLYPRLFGALSRVVEGAGGCRYPDTPCGDR
jgi:hypothetical protein